MTTFFLLIISVCFLAYSNGANDNFKGVATLYGSKTLSYKGALALATVSTFLGSVSALFIAEHLIDNFSGKGLVPDAFLQKPEFAIGVAAGAAITLFFATRLRMPVSTTHGLVGALVGCGFIAIGTSLDFGRLVKSFLVPLLITPLVACLLTFTLYWVISRMRKQKAANETDLPAAETQAAKRSTYIDALHWVSAGAVGFARGLNDAPKIVGLLLVFKAFHIHYTLLMVAIAMAVGGILHSRKVGEVLGRKITTLNASQGVSANLITSLLVTTSSIHGFPVSTNDVSVGSIFGIGVITKTRDYTVIRQILLSWLLTLPVAAILGGTVYWLVKTMGQ